MGFEEAAFVRRRRVERRLRISISAKAFVVVKDQPHGSAFPLHTLTHALKAIAVCCSVAAPSPAAAASKLQESSGSPEPERTPAKACTWLWVDKTAKIGCSRQVYLLTLKWIKTIGESQTLEQ